MVVSLFAVVLGAVLGPMVFTQTQASKDITYAQTISGATSGLQRMTREIRNAYRINATDGDATTGQGSMIDFFAYLSVNGTDADVEVKYSCSQPSTTKTGTYSCVRVQAPDGTALPSLASGAVIIERVQNPNVFKFIGADGAANPVYPAYVSASVQVPSSGSLANGLTHSITLNNGTALPNLQNGQ